MRKISKKIVLIGAIGVGKTSLVKRFVHSIFDEEYLSTIGVKVDKKEVILGEMQVNLMIWDLAGELIAKSLYNNYLRGADGVVGVFDLNRPETYHEILSEFELLDDKIKKVLVGNKLDLLSDTDLNKLDKIFDSAEYFTSAKTGVRVEKMFENIAKNIVESNAN
jgi:small GTP-binding protein